VVVGVVVGVVLLAAVAAGIGVAVLLNRPNTIIDLDPIGAQTPNSGGTSAPSARPVATGVTADCTAPPATDDAGQPVAYDAGNVLDGNRNTAWRCDGNGNGHTLTFTFPDGTTIKRVGLINGYAKTDPTSGAQRYGEYRRITRVTWTFDDGRAITQNLRDRTEKAQQIAVPPVATGRVTLTIERSTKPGQQANSRDAVLISEVTFG
jgi:hypothetical protein